MNTLCQSVRYHIRNIGQIRRFLDRDFSESIGHAFMTCCRTSTMLCSLELLTIQSTNCRRSKILLLRWSLKLLLSSKTFTGLPVQRIIQYKVVLQAEKVEQELAPTYILEHLQLYRPTRALSLATGGNFRIEPMTHSFWRDRALDRAALVLWNALPRSIKTANSPDRFNLVSRHIYSQVYWTDSSRMWLSRLL